MKHRMDFEPDEMEAIIGWHGGITSMMYAIVSTGALTLGTIRPYSHDEGRHLTDDEWFIHLVNKLVDEVEWAREKATARIEKGDSDSDELEEHVESFDNILERCRLITEGN